MRAWPRNPNRWSQTRTTTIQEVRNSTRGCRLSPRFLSLLRFFRLKNVLNSSFSAITISDYFTPCDLSRKLANLTNNFEKLGRFLRSQRWDHLYSVIPISLSYGLELRLTPIADIYKWLKKLGFFTLSTLKVSEEYRAKNSGNVETQVDLLRRAVHVTVHI